MIRLQGQVEFVFEGTSNEQVVLEDRSLVMYCI